MSSAKPQRVPAPSSAGLVLLALDGTPRVVLVFNKLSDERKIVPRDKLSKSDAKRIEAEYDDKHVIVSFDQKAGPGTPFGKAEDEDGGNSVITALRETLEETGTSADGRVIERISYTERPNSWGRYFNKVFLANGVGFAINKKEILDPLVDPHFSGFFPLARLPFYCKPANAQERKRPRPENIAGIYQAALRRILAILIQLDESLLNELGSEEKSPDNLIWMVADQIPYGHFFSYRMIRMFVEMKRPDIVVARLEKDDGIIRSENLAKQIGRNLIFWLPETMIEEALEALVKRCEEWIIYGSPNLAAYFGGLLIKRESSMCTAMERTIIEAEEAGLDREWISAVEEIEVQEQDERDVKTDRVQVSDADFRGQWLEAEAEEHRLEAEFQEFLKKGGS